MNDHKVIKTSIRDLVRTEALVTRIDWYVRYMHILVVHGYQLAKFIFLSEFQNNAEEFDVQDYLNFRFFERIILTLAAVHPNLNVNHPDTNNAIDIINRYIFEYLNVTHFRCVYNANLTQGAHYEAIKMATAYLVMVKNNFGNCLRRVVNHVLNVRARSAEIKRLMRVNDVNVTDEQINEAIRNQVTIPAAQFKRLIGTRNHDVPADLQVFYDRIRGLITYPEDYQFQRDNIYYDAKASPRNHFKNYYLMCQFLEGEEVRSYKCFPTRTSYIPSYTTIDSTILCTTLLNLGHLNTVAMQAVVLASYNGNTTAKKRGEVFAFRGTIMTDGVGVSVVNSRPQAAMAGVNTVHVEAVEEDEFQTIQHMNQQQLIALNNDVCFLDPGRQDILYGMHINSEPDHKIIYRYTRSTRARIRGIKSAREIRRNIPAEILAQPDAILAALRETNGSNVNIEDFIAYLTVKRNANVLYEFYGNYTPPGSIYPIFRKLRLSAYFGKVKEQYHLADSIRDRLGTNNLIVGNWSAPMARYFEPIKGRGLLRMLRRSGFNVMLIDEFRTSTFCPDCGQVVDKPFFCLNPRPYKRRSHHPFISCHGLLRCESIECQVRVNGHQKHRFWHRDTLAVLNFRLIFRSLIAGEGVPLRFNRPHHN